MTATIGEVQRPKENEVMGITTPKTEEAAAVAEVERFLIEQNPNGPVAKARPVTAETPVPQSPDLQKVGAVRVGSEEPVFDSVARDTKNFLDILGKPVTGKSIWGRLGSTGREWMNVLRRRKAEEDNPKNRYDSSQSEI